jgi:hypothetical protein
MGRSAFAGLRGMNSTILLKRIASHATSMRRAGPTLTMLESKSGVLPGYRQAFGYDTSPRYVQSLNGLDVVPMIHGEISDP